MKAAAAAAGVKDNFNRANEDLEANASWTLESGTGGPLSIVSEELACTIDTGNSEIICSHSDTLAQAQWASVVVTGDSGTGECITGVVVRHTTGANCYALHIDLSGSFIRIMEWNAYSVLNTVTLATAASQTGEAFTAPYTLKLTANSTALKAYINDVEITGLASTDSTHTEGLAGIGMLSATGTKVMTLDDFDSGDL